MSVRGPRNSQALQSAVYITGLEAPLDLLDKSPRTKFFVIPEGDLGRAPPEMSRLIENSLRDITGRGPAYVATSNTHKRQE